MQQEYIIQENNPTLLVFFAGWACDANPFRHYRPHGMDYLICYDYRDLSFDTTQLRGYQRYVAVGWSMGVWVMGLTAQQWIACGLTDRQHICLIGFNGTTHPIDSKRGLSVEVYQATLDGLTPASLQKFMRRMCGHSQAYRAFMETTPRRPFDEVKAELSDIRQHYTRLHNADIIDETEFDYFYGGTDDKIFTLFGGDEYWNHMTNRYCIPIRMACNHYDEPIFRFLLQDQWGMNFIEHQRYLKNVGTQHG